MASIAMASIATASIAIASRAIAGIAIVRAGLVARHELQQKGVASEAGERPLLIEHVLQLAALQHARLCRVRGRVGVGVGVGVG